MSKKTNKKRLSTKNLGRTSKKVAKKPFTLILGLVTGIANLPLKIWSFLKSVKRELKLVQWLSKRDTAKWSSAVILTALITGGVIVLIDLLLFKLRNLLFKL